LAESYEDPDFDFESEYIFALEEAADDQEAVE
jgi:hypothetical protein